MEAVIFDISGTYALFKKPYSPLSPVSFPVPPPTAIFGIVGTIIGLGKDEYLNVIKGWDNDAVRVGIQLLRPIQRYRTGLNLLRTKGTKFFRPAYKETRTQVPAEFLKDPGFRIFFAHEETDLLDELEERLKAGCTEYTPYLGIAQCIAQVTWQGHFEVKEINTEQSEMRFNCVIPVTTTQAKVTFEPRIRLTRLRVPARMQPDRTVVRFEDVIVDESAHKAGIPVSVNQYQKIGGHNILLF